MTTPNEQLKQFDDKLAELERATRQTEEQRREFINRNGLNKPAREGINNADSLIDVVLHFAIMRHDTDKVIEILNEKIKDYSGYKEKGLSNEDRHS